MSDYKLRLAKEADHSFIFSSFLKSLHDKFPRIPSSEFYKREHKRMERFLEYGITCVACLEDDEDVIIGWSNIVVVKNQYCVTYVYVKHSFRGQGIATSLLNEITLPLEHLDTKECVYNIQTCVNLIDKYGLIYNPYAIEEILEEIKR